MDDKTKQIVGQFSKLGMQLMLLGILVLCGICALAMFSK